MKTTICLTIAAFFVFGLILPAKTVAQEEFYSGTCENIQGFYTPNGKIPTAFKTIDYLELRNGREEFPTFGIIKLKGSGGSIKLLKPTLDDKNVSFKTKSFKRNSYEFTGTFTRLDMAAAEMDPDSKEILLSGKLKMLKSGKVVAEMDVKFTYYVGT